MQKREIGNCINEIKVSIIMPVFNSAKYLRQTLDSVVNQTFHDFELIAVNDGSTDNSEEILNEYKEKIEHFTIVNQLNSGVSSARNKGIDLANGKYISFLDSDDLLHKDYLKTLYEIADNNYCDIVICEYYLYYDKMNILNENIEGTIISENLVKKYGNKAFEYVMKQGFGTSPCIKLYKKEILNHYSIYFDIKSNFGEDMFFNWKLFLVSKSIIQIPYKLYGYRQNMNGATSKYHSHLFENYMREFSNLRKFAEKSNVDTEQLEISIQCNLAQRIISFLRMDIRYPGNLFQKYKEVKNTVNRPEVQHAVNIYETNRKTDTRLYQLIREKKYLKIFLRTYYADVRSNFVKKIKNILK